MWFDAHTTLLLTISAIIASCLTTAICILFIIVFLLSCSTTDFFFLFINTFFRWFRLMNFQTKCVEQDHYNETELNINIPKEMRKLSHSFNTMARNIEVQIEQLKHEQQEKSEMVQNLSHDLKTPLASITSYAEGLKDGVISTEEEQNKAYDVLIKQSQRIATMFDELTSVMSLNTVSRNNYEL